MSAPERRATRDDVARLAGTSVAVVSYVVNDGPRPVAAATRRRVLAAIESTGYRPNHIARALAAGATATYGLVVPDISNPFFAELAHEIEDAVFDAGRVLLLGDSAGSRERERELVRIFSQQRVDGVLIASVDDAPDLGPLLAEGVPVVSLDRAVVGASVTIAIDNRAAAQAATEHLIGHGHRDLALVGGPEGLALARDRERGWRDALAAAGIPADERRVLRAAFTRRSGYEAALELLGRDDIPTAVFAASDQQALGVLRAAYELGVRVPEQLAVITVDGTDDCRYTTPPLSTVRQPVERIAASAVERMLAAGRTMPAAPERIVVPADLVLRRSCGCPPVPEEMP